MPLPLLPLLCWCNSHTGGAVLVVAWDTHQQQAMVPKGAGPIVHKAPIV